MGVLHFHRDLRNFEIGDQELTLPDKEFITEIEIDIASPIFHFAVRKDLISKTSHEMRMLFCNYVMDRFARVLKSIRTRCDICLVIDAVSHGEKKRKRVPRSPIVVQLFDDIRRYPSVYARYFSNGMGKLCTLVSIKVCKSDVDAEIYWVLNRPKRVDRNKVLISYDSDIAVIGAVHEADVVVLYNHRYENPLLILNDPKQFLYLFVGMLVVRGCDYSPTLFTGKVTQHQFETIGEKAWKNEDLSESLRTTFFTLPIRKSNDYKATTTSTHNRLTKAVAVGLAFVRNQPFKVEEDMNWRRWE